MRHFKPTIYRLVQYEPWWMSASCQARLVWLLLVFESCEGTGGVALGSVWYGVYGLAAASGLDLDATKAALDQLLRLRAIVDGGDPARQWYYEIPNFQRYADALDTHRALTRRSYRKSKGLPVEA